MNSPRESAEQKAVIKWANEVGLLKYRELAIPFPSGPRFPIWMTKNEGKKTERQGGNDKRMGVLSGVPDLYMPVKRSCFSGLFIEMKRVKPRGTVTPNQRAMIGWLKENGHCALVCYGAEDAIDRIEWYLGLEG